MGLFVGDRVVNDIPSEGIPITIDPVFTSAEISGFTFYVDGNGNLNILAPDGTTITPLVLSGSGPPILP